MIEAVVEALGAQGDGLARLADGRRLYIPLTLPGERVEVRVGSKRGDGWLAEAVRWIETSADRADPLCPLFGTCGGCALRHPSPPAYAAWKRAQVTEALGHRGLGEVPVAAPVLVPAGTRRRATFNAIRLRDRTVLGFSARLSHQVMDLPGCPLLLPVLNEALPGLRETLGRIMRSGERATVRLTATQEGLDLLLGLPRRPGPAETERLAALAGVGRISWQGGDGAAIEPLLQLRRLHVRLSEAMVEFPPGAFLQPSAEGEAELIRLVVGAVGKARKILDLYAGLGTFSLALARAGFPVRAVEAEATAVKALGLGAGQAGLGGRVAAEARDLDRRPLSGTELKPFDTVVLDPPRAGAAVQAEALARAPTIRRVVAVSCNPATLARDLRTLVDGGFKVLGVTPVDQFPYAAHVEAVALLER